MTREDLLDRQDIPESTRIAGGFLNIDKPAGWTSHDVVAKIRRLLPFKRVGHLGTLDPQATGVLPICFGKGTKLAYFLADRDKEYEAVLRMGKETETEDASGKVTASLPVPDAFRTEQGLRLILDTMASFVGAYMQQPPMYSAVKIGGIPLFRAARNGKVIARPSRLVTIRSIAFLEKHGDDIAFRVSCSKGTYIRTLCADIGAKLGTGGHLLSLRRTRSGGFYLDRAIEIESFSEICKKGDWEKAVYPLNTAMKDFPRLWVKGAYVTKLLNGVQIGFDALDRWNRFKKGETLQILDSDERLVAVGLALHDSDYSITDRGCKERPFRIKTVLGPG